MSELLLFFHSSLCYFFGGQRVLSQLFVWLRGLVSWRLFIYLFCALHRRCLKSLRLFFEQFALLTFGGSLKSFLLHSIKCRNGSWSKIRDRIPTFVAVPLIASSTLPHKSLPQIPDTSYIYITYMPATLCELMSSRMKYNSFEKVLCHYFCFGCWARTESVWEIRTRINFRLPKGKKIINRLKPVATECQILYLWACHKSLGPICCQSKLYSPK